jgi:hypothetical protein
VTDSIRDLAHDHGELNRHLLAVGALIRRLQSNRALLPVLVADLAAIRDLLFVHFAREEEGLFPFVAEALPDLAVRVADMATAHDTICGALARTCHLAAAGAEVEQIVAVHERFEVAYAGHASLEAQLLEELGRRLDARARAEVTAVIAGL